MGRWRWAWAMGVCLVMVGCESSPPETPSDGERTGSVPDQGTPPEGGGSSGNAGTPSPLEEATPSLPARECIAWPHPTPPAPATACASDTVYADGKSEHARYDADSHPVEVRFLDASGAVSKVETQTWRDGLERLARTDYPSGRFSTTEWTYNAQSKLSRRLYTYGSDTHSFDYTYDAQGRISQIATRIGDGRAVTNRYTYDAAGRLTSITSDGDCGYDDTRCATLAYWPNGNQKQHDWESGHEAFTDDYNELGQIIHSKMRFDEAGAESTRAYDSAGRLVRMRESYKGGSATDIYREILATTAFDPGGQRERYAEDRHEVCPDDNCGPNKNQPDSWTYTRVTHRTTYFCGTQLVALDEWDSNEDGVVDAQRTHDRDDTGRLVHEAYSGTPGLDDGPVSRDFQYDCR